MSIRTLALYAQRVGKVVAHPGTWAKLIRDRGSRRPRLRVYPPKPKNGVRASAPNEAWHTDVTILKLLDGTKGYLHAVIDNCRTRRSGGRRLTKCTSEAAAWCRTNWRSDDGRH